MAACSAFTRPVHSFWLHLPISANFVYRLLIKSRKPDIEASDFTFHIFPNQALRRLCGKGNKGQHKVCPLVTFFFFLATLPFVSLSNWFSHHYDPLKCRLTMSPNLREGLWWCQMSIKISDQCQWLLESLAGNKNVECGRNQTKATAYYICRRRFTIPTTSKSYGSTL